MKRILTLTLTSLFFSIIAAQTINIQWNGSKAIDYGSSKTIVPFFTNEGFAFEEGTIFFRSNEKLSGGNQKIGNLVWEKITPKEIFEISTLSIPTEENSEIASYTNPYTQEKTVNIRVSTLPTGFF